MRSQTYIMKTWCRPDTAGHSSCTGAFLNSTVICAIALLNPYRYAISKVSIAHALNEIYGLAMIGPVLAGSERDDSASRAAVLQNCVTYSTQVPCAVRSTQSRIRIGPDVALTKRADIPAGQLQSLIVLVPGMYQFPAVRRIFRRAKVERSSKCPVVIF